jgi:Ca2+-transporting ATPase
VQILWINMTTAVLLGLMLAFEPKEPGLMDRPTRDPRGPILRRPLVIRVLLAGLLLLAASYGLFEWELSHGEPIEVARTAAVNMFVVGGVFYLFNCRSLRHSMFRLGVFTNTWALGGVSLMLLLQLAFTYVPFMNRAFSSAPLDGTEWGLIVAAGLVLYAVIGAEKLIHQRRGTI